MLLVSSAIFLAAGWPSPSPCFTRTSNSACLQCLTIAPLIMVTTFFVPSQPGWLQMLSWTCSLSFQHWEFYFHQSNPHIPIFHFHLAIFLLYFLNNLLIFQLISFLINLIHNYETVVLKLRTTAHGALSWLLFLGVKKYIDLSPQNWKESLKYDSPIPPAQLCVF